MSLVPHPPSPSKSCPRPATVLGLAAPSRRSARDLDSRAGGAGARRDEPSMTPEAFEELVGEALDFLPEEFHEKMENVEVEPMPSV